MAKHMVIPDCQVKPGIDTTYLRAIGQYAVEKKPDTIVCLGDFADMPSLSSYDYGKKSFEGRRYHEDIKAAQAAMTTLLSPIWEYNNGAKVNKKKAYKPRLILTLGNHEDRITRAVESDPKFEGTIGLPDLGYENFGWEVYPYQDVVLVDGVAYSHYFTSGAMGRPVTGARLLVNKKHMSCVQGHMQKYEIYTEYRADGRLITGLFAGSCYEHNEDYLGLQGNNYFRGIHMLYEVCDGEFHPHAITLSYLKQRFQ